MDLGVYLKSLNSQKLHLMLDPETLVEAEKDYKPFIINRCFSNFPDTIFFAQNMNIRPFLDVRMQYDYLFYAVRKRSRFSPWHKADKIENLEIVKEYFGYSNSKAKEALRILTEDDIEYIQSKLEKGGRKKIKGE
jgi:hypothetical protein